MKHISVVMPCYNEEDNIREAYEQVKQVGFSRGEALAYIIVAQAIIYIVVTIWGLLGLWRLGARDIYAEAACSKE